MHRCFLGLMVMLMGINMSLITSCSNSSSKKDVNYVTTRSEQQSGIVHETTKDITENRGSGDATAVIEQGSSNQGNGTGTSSNSGVVDSASENMALLTSCVTSAESAEEGLIPLLEANCARCHTVGPGSAYWVPDNHQATCGRLLGGLGENDRYNVVENVGRVFLTLPDQSRLVSKLQAEHNCWSGSCEEDAAAMQAAISKWSKDTQDLRTRIAAEAGGVNAPEVALTGLSEAPSEGVRVNFVKLEAEDPNAIKVGEWAEGNLEDGGKTMYQMDANNCGNQNERSWERNSALASINFPLTVEQSGDYFLYVSLATDAGNQNSFFYAVDNVPFYNDPDNPAVNDPAHDHEVSGNVEVPILARASIENDQNNLLTPLTGLVAGQTVNVTMTCREIDARLDFVMLCQNEDPANCIIPEEETEYYLDVEAKDRVTGEEFCGMPAKLRFRFFVAQDGNYVLRKPQLLDPSSTPENAMPLSTGAKITNLRVGVYDGTNVIYDTTRSGFNKEYISPTGSVEPFAENAIIVDAINKVGLDKISLKFECEQMP
ncbi:MAG: hypothetical protein AB8G05_17030 [Oligoflexales bacterium]